MIDSGRFVVTHNETEAVNDDPMEDHSLTDAANAGTEWGLSQAFSQSTLFDLGQIDVRWDEDLATLWAFMTPLERPNSNLGLMRDTMAWQRESRRVFGDNGPLKFMVLGSRFPGVFNLGGDLEMFAECIQRRDQLPDTQRIIRTSLQGRHTMGLIKFQVPRLERIKPDGSVVKRT